MSDDVAIDGDSGAFIQRKDVAWLDNVEDD